MVKILRTVLCSFQKNTYYFLFKVFWLRLCFHMKWSSNTGHNKIIIVVKFIHNFNIYGKVPSTKRTKNKTEL